MMDHRPYAALLAKGEDRRQRIIGVAQRLLARQGWRGTTLGQMLDRYRQSLEIVAESIRRASERAGTGPTSTRPSRPWKSSRSSTGWRHRG
jgi:hypothetical protein